MACYAGADGLDAFPSGCDILVRLLPLTGKTRGTLCATSAATAGARRWSGSWTATAGAGARPPARIFSVS